jgi:hypothetical protein
MLRTNRSGKPQNPINLKSPYCHLRRWQLTSIPFMISTNGEWRSASLTPGQLVHAVTIAMDVPRKNVVAHDRNLVLAGLRTIGGRGRSAPAVTPLDAARLLVSNLAALRTMDSVSTIRAFESAMFVPPATYASAAAALRDEGNFEHPDLKFYDAEDVLDLPIFDLPKKHNFVEAVAKLIANASAPVQQDQFDQYLRRFADLEIVCVAPEIYGRIARIRPESDSAIVYEPAARSVSAALRNEDKPRSPSIDDRYKRYLMLQGVHQNRSVCGNSILLLGRAFREGGLPFKTTREALVDLSKTVSGGAKTKKPAKKT